MDTTLLASITLPELTDLVRRAFETNKQMVKPQAAQLFISDPIGKGKGNTKRYHEYDVETFARNKAEGERAKRASVGIGYNVTLTKKRVAREVAVTQEMLDENQYAKVGTDLRSLMHYCTQRHELDLSHIFTFCNATSYTDMDGETVTTSVGDGLALLSTVHTVKFGSATYSNRVSGDPIFSQGGLEAAESLAVSNILSNFGERRVMKFNTIVTSDDPNTCNRVKRVLNSTADVDGAHSGIENVNQKKYRHVELPYLATTATGARDATKAKWWFLVAAGQGTDGWQAYNAMFEEEHLKDSSKGNNEDYSADIMLFGVRKGYGIRAVTGRGVIGSLAS